MSAVEVRFEHLSIDADVRVGGRALPTVFNTFLNFIEVGALGTDALKMPQDRMCVWFCIHKCTYSLSCNLQWTISFSQAGIADELCL